MPGGNVGPGIIVDLTHWTSLEAEESAPDHLWAGPGVIGDRLEEEARGRGLSFPPLPSSSDRCRVGGMLANNAAGARSFGYGAVREWVDAIEVVTADGEHHLLERSGPPVAFGALRDSLETRWGPAIREGWPRVRKNSSGYALNHFLPKGDPVALMVGSEGSLAVITRARLRLTPRPHRRALVVVALPTLDPLTEVGELARSAGAAACEFFGGRFLDVGGLRVHPRVGSLARDAAALVVIELDDGQKVLEASLAALEGDLGGLGLPRLVATERAERDHLWALRRAASPTVAARAADGLVSMQFIEDSVVPPAAVTDYLVGLQAILDQEETDAVMFGHAGDGNVHVNPLVDIRRAGWRERVGRILDATVSLVADLGGTLAGEHGDGRLRPPFHPRIWGTPVTEAFRHVKERMDPKGILNPGVVVAGPDQDPLETLAHREAG